MPSPGDNLSLNKLATATQSFAGGIKLSLAAGSTLSPASISEFTITGITTPTVNASTFSFGSTIVITSNFTGAGSKFLSRVASQANNFIWSTPGNMSLTVNEGYRRTYTNTYNPGGTGCSSSVTRSVTVQFMDTFNTPATNWNTVLTTSTFTLFSPPKPSVTGVGLDRPFNPCNSGGGCGGTLCYGASFRLSGNAGTYNGVTGTQVSYYVAGTLLTTVAGATSTYDTDRIYCGSTAYSVYVTNNHGCQSDTISLTTLAYV